MNKNIRAHDFHLSRSDKELKNGHKGTVLWLCGLSGSGKSTIANLAEQKLFEQNKQVAILDGDGVRNGLCKDLGFEQHERLENLRRVAEVAKLFAQNGNIVLCSFITPLNEQREMIQKILGGDFNLIYVKADLETCESRDPKGLYKKARAGEIPEFTGVSSKFDEPENAKLVLDTSKISAEEAANKLVELI